MSRLRMPYFSLASTTIERPSGVSSASEASCAASASSCSVTPRTGRNAVAWRLPSVMVPVLSSSKRIDVAGGLDRAAGHRQHVEAHQPVHAGDADRRQQRADGGRDQRHEQRHQHHDRDRAAGIGRVARDRHGREHEDDGEAREQDIERDLVRRLLPLGALHQLDHAVDEGRALRCGDADADPVRQHLRAAGHRRAVAAGFADHGRGFAGDRGFVDGSDALDHLAVGGDVVAGFDQHDIADLEAGAGHQPIGLAGTVQQLGLALGAGLLQRLRLRLAAAFGDGFGEIGEQHREPQPQDDLEGEAEASPPPVTRSRRKMTVVSAATTSTTNITGFLIISRGSSLTKAEPIAGTTIFGSSIVDAVTFFCSFMVSMDVTPRWDRSEQGVGVATRDARRSARAPAPGRR